MSECIDGKIQNDLLQPVGVAIDFHAVDVRIQGKPDSSLFGERADERDAVVQHCIQIAAGRDWPIRDREIAKRY